MVEEPNYAGDEKKHDVYWVTDPSTVPTTPCRSGYEVISAVATLGGVGTHQFAIGTFFHSKNAFKSPCFVPKLRVYTELACQLPVSWVLARMPHGKTRQSGIWRLILRWDYEVTLGWTFAICRRPEQAPGFSSGCAGKYSELKT